jgi:hypothetical protein
MLYSFIVTFYLIFMGQSEPNLKEKIFVNITSDPMVPKPVQSLEILELQRRLNLTNPGHMGKGVFLPEKYDNDIDELFNNSIKMYGYNEMRSQLIPLDRELPDLRSNYCMQQNYSKELPAVSVVSVFHNEPPSLILRTVYSILNRSPPKLIVEIILVDDCSENGEFESRFSLN